MFAIVTTEGTPVSFGAGIAGSAHALAHAVEVAEAVYGKGRHVKEIDVIWDDSDKIRFRDMWRDFTGPRRTAHAAYQPRHRNNDTSGRPLR